MELKVIKFSRNKVTHLGLKVEHSKWKTNFLKEIELTSCSDDHYLREVKRNRLFQKLVEVTTFYETI